MDEVVLSSCFLLFKNSIPTSTHIKPQISTAVEMCGNLWVAFSQDYTHRFSQRWKSVEICGWPLAKTTPTATHKFPQRWKSVEICGLMWVTWFVNFDLSILFPVRPMLGHMMLFAFMSFGDLNQAHVGHARSLARSSRSPFVLSSLLLSMNNTAARWPVLLLLLSFFCRCFCSRNSAAARWSVLLLLLSFFRRCCC